MMTREKMETTKKIRAMKKTLKQQKNVNNCKTR